MVRVKYFTGYTTKGNKRMKLSPTAAAILDKAIRLGVKNVSLDGQVAEIGKLSDKDKSIIIDAAKAAKSQIEAKVKSGSLPENSVNGISHAANHLFAKISKVKGNEISFTFGKKKKVVRFD